MTIRSANTDATRDITVIKVFSDGTFDLYDKQSEIRYTGLNRFVDTEDIGDEYDYAPCKDSKTVYPAQKGTIRILEKGPLIGQIEIRVPFNLPVSIKSKTSGSKQ